VTTEKRSPENRGPIVVVRVGGSFRRALALFVTRPRIGAGSHDLWGALFDDLFSRRPQNIG